MSRLVDTNVLINATDPQARQHSAAKAWLDEALNDRGVVYLPWESLLAFMRLVTETRPGRPGIPVDAAASVVRLWLDRPNVVVPQPDSRHLHRVTELLGAAGRGGPLVMDAHLAALAIQHDATIITFDSDFARFPGVRWQRPGA